MATRQAPKALNKDARTIQANADADKARKAASKKALKEASKLVKDNALITTAEPKPEPAPEVDHSADNLDAARIEAEATGMSFEEACDSMGIDPKTGKPVEPEKSRYSGPMLALVAARRSYVKAANGIQCNGDEIATSLGNLSRPDVISACMSLLNLESNPYAHLNPGQQSMNLRNKLRHAVKSGKVDMVAVRIAVQARLTK